MRTPRRYDQSAMANVEKQYTVTLNEHQLGELMMAVEATRNAYREKVDNALQRGRRIEHLGQAHGILKQALRDPVEASDPRPLCQMTDLAVSTRLASLQGSGGFGELTYLRSRKQD